MAPGPLVTSTAPSGPPPYFTCAEAANPAVSSCRTWTNCVCSLVRCRAEVIPLMPSPGKPK